MCSVCVINNQSRTRLRIGSDRHCVREEMCGGDRCVMCAEQRDVRDIRYKEGQTKGSSENVVW